MVLVQWVRSCGVLECGWGEGLGGEGWSSQGGAGFKSMGWRLGRCSAEIWGFEGYGDDRGAWGQRIRTKVLIRLDSWDANICRVPSPMEDPHDFNFGAMIFHVNS